MLIGLIIAVVVVVAVVVVKALSSNSNNQNKTGTNITGPKPNQPPPPPQKTTGTNTTGTGGMAGGNGASGTYLSGPVPNQPPSPQKRPTATGARGVEGPPPQPENQVKPVDVYFGVFFDGTSNHKEQARIGEEYREMSANGPAVHSEFTAKSLQERDRSNVALLHTYYNQQYKKYVCELYVEGIGTHADGREDLFLGQGFGEGVTGIKAKVEKAINNIPNKINELTLEKGTNICLYFGLYGFSRGAAAARHFVWNILNKQDDIKKKTIKYKISDITIDYVGLFDTVSSYGLSQKNKNMIDVVAGAAVVTGNPIIAGIGVVGGTISALTPKHENNVKSLNLDAIQKAKKVFHICAADEFRENFALTNIQSAGSKGTEIFIPGSHTDIGGGSKPENKNEIEIKSPNKEKLINDGWRIGNLPLRGYSNIALHLMAEDAKENRFIINEKHKIHNDLQKIKGKINNFKPSSIDLCQKVFKSDYVYLRQNWLHFSAKEGDFVDNPRKNDNGNLERFITNG